MYGYNTALNIFLMSITNKKQHPFDKRYGNTHIENICLLLLLIAIDLFIFSREHLRASAGWTFMCIIVMYVFILVRPALLRLSVFSNMGMRIKKIKLFLKAQFFQLGKVAITQPPFYRYSIVFAGIIVGGLFNYLGIDNMQQEDTRYVIVPCTVGSLLFVLFTVIPLIGIYLYTKRRKKRLLA